MPLISTLGACSAKSFGFGSTPAGPTLYEYYHATGQSLQPVGSIYATSPNIDSSPILLKEDTSGTINNRAIFAFAKNQMILGPYFGSTDGGVNWVTWGHWWVSSTSGGGLNGAVGYNSSNSAVVMGWADWYGDGLGYQGVKYIKEDGTYGGSSTPYYASGPKSVLSTIYSPALDVFIVRDSALYYNIYSGTDFSLLATNYLSANSNYALSVSSDGYPLYVTTGFTRYLRKITNTSFSYTQLGTMSDSYSSYRNTTFMWSPSRNLYFKVAAPSSNTVLVISTSSNGYQWTAIEGLNLSGFAGADGLHLWEDGSTLYIQGTYYNTNEGYYTPFRQYSTDGGYTWTDNTYYNIAASTKRLT